MSKKYIYMLFIFILFAVSTYIFSLNYEQIEDVKYVYDSNDLNCKFSISNINEKNEKYEILAYYPITENKELNKKINESINSYMEKFKNNLVDGVNKLTIKFDSFENDKCTSFVFNASIQKDSSHSIDYVFSYSIDNNKKSIVTIDKLLNEGYNLNKISECILIKLQEDENIKKYGNIDEIKKYFNGDKKKYSNFYFTKNEIIFFFNPGEITPNVAGILYIPVQIDKIKQ